MRKILIVVALCVILMTIEVVGGIKVNSLAIFTDAAHLLSDVAAFAISLFLPWASGWEATSITIMNSQSQSRPEDDSSEPAKSHPSEPQSGFNDSNSSPDVTGPDLADNDDVQVQLNTQEGKGGIKLRSEVWNHFVRRKVNGVQRAFCKYCPEELCAKGSSGTSHLRNHYTNKHSKNENIRQKLLTSNFNKDHPHMASHSFNPAASKKELATMIIMHEYPLSIVDQVRFKRYSASLQPLFKVPCRNTIKSEIFRIYKFEKVKLLSLMESNKSRIAIITDMWTASNQKKGYMAVTAYFIDDSWTLQSRIMRFIYVPCPHSKYVLCEHLVDFLLDWNLDKKISCVTVDNCTTNDAMIESVLERLDNSSLLAGGNLFHMRCSSHILNLIVKDGLDEIKIGVGKVRESVAYWTATPKRDERFEETARQSCNPNTKELGLDCITRWNSTYLMLETALLYKDVFTRLSRKEPQYKSVPSPEEWEFAKEASHLWDMQLSIMTWRWRIHALLEKFDCPRMKMKIAGTWKFAEKKNI
ncbi:zinc finger BED domain-containing protein RICESLEEPER 1-like [Apium graveolens]|uniref:zinc finger BED domain-containing protein RICESLEEPER 1-like n=1 Tax=Apium graveolens TaxID=4045 RepID=UPI003D7AC920